MKADYSAGTAGRFDVAATAFFSFLPRLYPVQPYGSFVAHQEAVVKGRL